ncbi:hypothetical protein AABB24_037729 [Solanum stoloniferum]|uniref:TFIIB-type domain-containing protein n=1 Tax=Solanum stoloniferum TaxID=62892 RepID=A0ABD2R5T4_9SOLN
MGDPYCSDCKRNTEVVFDHAAGDTVCSECELVLESRSIDETSEWRTFADESGDHDPNRVGGPVNPFLGDVGLSIVISKGPNGSNGDSSLARLQNRGGDPERALVMAFKAIANMADRTEQVRYTKGWKTEVYERKESGCLGGCLYIHCVSARRQSTHCKRNMLNRQWSYKKGNWPSKRVHCETIEG